MSREATTTRGDLTHREEGSIVLVLVLVMVLLLIVAGIGTETISQLEVSTNLSSSNTSLQASLSGNEAVVAAIRATAVDANGNVVTAQLPCGPVAGPPNASTGVQYAASVTYYEENVAGTYTQLNCTGGTVPPAASGQHLARAVVISCAPAGVCPAGSASATGPNWRRTVSTYTFKTTNVNIPGGLVNSYQFGECMVASYVNGADVTGGLRLDVTSSCGASSSLDSQEKFQYTQQQQLEVVLGGTPYCVQDPELASPAATTPLLFGTCTNAAVSQWGIDDSAEIGGVLAGGTGNPNGWCIDNPLGDSAPAAGSTVTQPALLAACAGGYDNTRTWQLSPAVGAGAAAPVGANLFGPTNQLVNYQEFGRCMDVTNQSVTSPFLIDYTCKQFPNTTAYPTWNQRWCFQPQTTGGNVGVLYVELGSTSCAPPAGISYCLQSPLQPASSSLYATLTNACSSSATNQQWTAWSSTGGAVHAYTWTDASGYCLEANLATPRQPSGNGDAFAPIQVDTCNGAYQEKWNAPATYGQSQVSDTHEGTGPGAYAGP